MPLVAKDQNGERVTIFDVLRRQERGEFYCIYCGSRMHIVHSTRRIPHFRHNPKTSCGFGKESLRHLEMKAVAGLWLKSKGWGVDFEVKFGPRIADVFAERGDFKIVVEVQHSTIHFEEVVRRTLIDKRNGFKTLWLFDGFKFDKLVDYLNKEGFKGYILDMDTTPPKVYLDDDKAEMLMRVSPVDAKHNFVVLGYDPTIVKTDYCPRCYSRDLIDVYDWDMVHQSLLASKKMCMVCGFEV